MPTTHAKPLPKSLVQRYQGPKASTCTDDTAWFRRLSEDERRPRAMVISCCDSRVHVTGIFGADQVDDDIQVEQLEKLSVRVSLGKPLTFPFVTEAVKSGDLPLYGVWNDTGAGGLEDYDPQTDAFRLF